MDIKNGYHLLSTSDHQIRSALRQRLNKRYANAPHAVILEEFTLGRGSSRVDIVVVTNRLHGFELKSDRDTLRRLPDQISIYGSVLDRVTLVVGYQHAFEALNMVPEWWGVNLVAVGPRGGLRFSNARDPKDNPSPEKAALAGLLWRDEALRVLEWVDGAAGFRSKPRAAICARIAEVASADVLRSAVCHYLKHRKPWLSAGRQT